MENPVVDLLVDGHDAQSESDNALKPEVVDPEKRIADPGDCFMYLNTLCAAFRSFTLGFAML